MTRLFFVLLALLSPATVVFGQEKPDFQLRLPTHVQIFTQADSEAKDRFGLAVWGILPDVTLEKSRVTTLLVGGLVWQHNKKNWVEVLGGVRLNQNGYKDPILNVRVLWNQVPRVAISGEIQQSFRMAKRRTVYWIAVDTPTGIWKLRAGVETENIHFFGKNNSLGAGPRVALPLPWKLPNGVKVSAVATYQFRNDKNFVRVYVITNLSFGGK